MEAELEELLSLARLHPGALPVPSLEPILQQLAQCLRGPTCLLALSVVRELIPESGPELEAVFPPLLAEIFRCLCEAGEQEAKACAETLLQYAARNFEQVASAACRQGLQSPRWQGRLRTLQLLQTLPREGWQQDNVRQVLQQAEELLRDSSVLVQTQARSFLRSTASSVLEAKQAPQLDEVCKSPVPSKTAPNGLEFGFIPNDIAGQLQESDPRARARAAEALEDLLATADLEALVPWMPAFFRLLRKLLQDSGLKVTQSALTMVARLLGQPSIARHVHAAPLVPLCLEKLGDSNVHTRQAAFRTVRVLLREVPQRLLFPHLQGAMNGANWLMRVGALHVLLTALLLPQDLQFDFEDMVPPVADLLEDPKPKVAFAALETLAVLGRHLRQEVVIQAAPSAEERLRKRWELPLPTLREDHIEFPHNLDLSSIHSDLSLPALRPAKTSQVNSKRSVVSAPVRELQQCVKACEARSPALQQAALSQLRRLLKRHSSVLLETWQHPVVLALVKQAKSQTMARPAFRMLQELVETLEFGLDGHLELLCDLAVRRASELEEAKGLLHALCKQSSEERVLQVLLSQASSSPTPQAKLQLCVAFQIVLQRLLLAPRQLRAADRLWAVLGAFFAEDSSQVRAAAREALGMLRLTFRSEAEVNRALFRALPEALALELKTALLKEVLPTARQGKSASPVRHLHSPLQDESSLDNILNVAEDDLLSNDWQIRHKAVSKLGELVERVTPSSFKATRLASLLSRAAADKNPSVCLQALECVSLSLPSLGRTLDLHSAELVKVLCRALLSSPAVRRAAAGALRELLTYCKGSVLALAAALSTAGSRIRVQALSVVADLLPQMETSAAVRLQRLLDL